VLDRLTTHAHRLRVLIETLRAIIDRCPQRLRNRPQSQSIEICREGPTPAVSSCKGEGLEPNRTRIASLGIDPPGAAKALSENKMIPHCL
jgi:hypothetical protein